LLCVIVYFLLAMRLESVPASLSPTMIIVCMPWIVLTAALYCGADADP
jgi:hypothetical protein